MKRANRALRSDAQLGAFASVQLGALCFDTFGSYRPLIVALSLLTVAGALASWFILRIPAPLARAGLARATDP